MNLRGWLRLPGPLQAAGERTEERRCLRPWAGSGQALQLGCEFWWVVPSAVEDRKSALCKLNHSMSLSRSEVLLENPRLAQLSAGRLERDCNLF